MLKACSWLPWPITSGTGWICESDSPTTRNRGKNAHARTRAMRPFHAWRNSGPAKKKEKRNKYLSICWQHLLMRSVQGEEKRSDCWHWIFRSGLAMTRNLMVKKWKESEDSKETKIGKGREFFEDGRIKRYVATVFRRDIYILVSFFFTFYETIKV